MPDPMSFHAPALRERIVAAIRSWLQGQSEGVAAFDEVGEQVQLHGVFVLPSLANAIIDNAIAPQQTANTRAAANASKIALRELPASLQAFQVAVSISRSDAPGVDLTLRLNVPSATPEKMAEIVGKWFSSFTQGAIQNMYKRLDAALESGDPRVALDEIEAIEVDIERKGPKKDVT